LSQKKTVTVTDPVNLTRLRNLFCKTMAATLAEIK